MKTSVMVLSALLALLCADACLAVQVTENLATSPARRPQWIVADNTLALTWVTPLRRDPDDSMYRELHYAIIAQGGQPLPPYPVKGSVLSVPTQSYGKFPYCRITQDIADPRQMFWVEGYDGGSSSGLIFHMYIHKLHWNNNTITTDYTTVRFTSRVMPDDPDLFVDHDHWVLSFLSGGGISLAESRDGGKTWGAMSRIVPGPAELQALGAYDGAYYVASVKGPPLPARSVRGWPD